jgi:acetyl-CoA C-acetyltransferase
MRAVFIVSAKRTPTGSFLGALHSMSTVQLGAVAIEACIKNISADVACVDSVYMGNVLSAGLGQSPARQAALLAGLPDSTDCTTVNKVCSSGLKAVMLGAQQIRTGEENLIVCGGMESMSNTPHYIYRRHALKLNDDVITDGLLKDGLTDGSFHFHMGTAAEGCAKEFSLTREMQDEYAVQSYQKAEAASAAGKFDTEIAAIKIQQKSKEILINRDEDVSKLILEKVPLLAPAFDKEGTITAANASNINDGAAALLLASGHALQQHSFTPQARIVCYADAAQSPEKFATAPAAAVAKVLAAANMRIDDIDFIEINEAYAAVVLANQRLIGFDLSRTNIYGGAIALGHPLGASGARILCTLLSVLSQEKGRFGLACICNGGGGASAMIIENLDNSI